MRRGIPAAAGCAQKISKKGSEKMFNVLAMDIGGTNFRLGLFDHEGRLLTASRFAVAPASGREWMLEQLGERSRGLMKQSDLPVRACGVSFGGPVDFSRQVVTTSHHASGWDQFPLSKWVEEKLGLKCLTDNDANAGAWGEFRFGAGRGADSLVYITISTGIGAGVIIGGKVYRGKDNLAGELGHIPVSESGSVCTCGGRGCIETFCSATAITLRAQGFASRKPDVVPHILEFCGGNPQEITAEMVFKAAAEGEGGAVFIVNESARWLARGIMMIIRLINPDRVVLGGGVARAGSGLLDPIRANLDSMDSPSLKTSSSICLAELGDSSALYGAAGLALEAAHSAA